MTNEQTNTRIGRRIRQIQSYQKKPYRLLSSSSRSSASRIGRFFFFAKFAFLPGHDVTAFPVYCLSGTSKRMPAASVKILKISASVFCICISAIR